MAYKQTPLNMGPSPLKGNYESGVDGIRYVSTAPAFQDMQNKIAGGTAKAIDGLKPKEPDTSKETNSSDYDNSVTNNYYYGNQGKDKGRFNFDVDVPTVEKLEVKGFDPKDFPTTEGSGGGGGNSGTIENKRTTKRNITGDPVEEYLLPKNFEGGAKNPEYIKKKKALDKAIAGGAGGRYKDRTLFQDQQQTGSTINGKTTLGNWMNVGEEYENN